MGKYLKKKRRETKEEKVGSFIVKLSVCCTITT